MKNKVKKMAKDAMTLGIAGVGLGVMGGRMTKRLMDAGHTVTGYNRTKAKADWLVELGMRWADSPRAVAEAADLPVVVAVGFLVAIEQDLFLAA